MVQVLSRWLAIGLAAVIFLGGHAAQAVDSAKIIGGVTVSERRWPVQVSIQYGSPSSHFCGGTLLSADWVMTASHCFYNSRGQLVLRASDLTVVAGTDNNSDGSGQRRSVTRLITHPSYNSTLDDNDIALLQLSQSVTINNPVMLATPETDAVWAGTGQVVTATGWGNTNATGTANYPSRLQQVDLTVTSQSSCNTAYGGDITANMICAASPGKDTCQGDSGGPLFASNHAGGVIQVGITSFGIGCAEAAYPGVYTRVSRYNDWVRSYVPAALLSTTLQSGWWYVADQPARGYSIEFRSGRLYFAGYLYDTDGSAVWYTSSGSMNSATTYAGTLQKFAGGQTLTGPYAAPVMVGTVGSVAITFTSDTTAVMSLNGQVANLVRYDIAAGGVAAGPASGMPETGWYWNAAEGGRGYFIEAQRDQIFFGGFMYRADGQPVWYYFSAQAVANAAGGVTIQSPLNLCAGGQPVSDAAHVPTCASTGQSVALVFTNPFTATLMLPDGRAISLARFTLY